ncbi:MAG: hypothetical protein ACK4HG_05745 [Agrobacterium albertimagni]
MDDQDLRHHVPLRHRAHLKAVIASLFASLLLVFGGDAFGRLHHGSSNARVLTLSDAGQLVAGAVSDTRYVSASERSSRPKLKPGEAGDGFVVPEIHAFQTSRHGDLVQRLLSDRAVIRPPLAYRSRAPPTIQPFA